MNNNKIGNIAIKTASRPRARFNLSHDVNTTFSFGDIQPAMCRLLPANSKTSVEVESLVRLAPLLSPTFGRIKYKQYHHFVGMSTLTENFAPMMAQQAVSRSQGTFQPTDLPFCKLSYLSRLILIGAKCTIYDGNNGGDDSGAQITVDLYKVTDINNLPARASSILSGAFASSYNASGSIPAFDNYSGPTLNLQYIFNDYSSGQCIIPIANQTGWSFFDVQPSALTSFVYQTFSGDVTTVMLDSADYVVTRPTTGTSNLTFAFRLSAFGKRLRKVLLGCGYQIDFRSDRQVSLMPLFATYKAYFDSFGLTLYNKWETTNVYKILRYTDNYYASADFNNWLMGVSSYLSLQSDFFRFINDVGNMWYTDSQDFVSAHITNTAVSSSTASENPRLISVDSSNSYHPNVDYSDITQVLASLSNPNGHAYIDAVKHGYLDSEYLKILYHRTNKNTIAGQRIAELLRAAGLGKYVDEDKSDFIGENETIVTISDVVSTSDTYQNNGGVKSGQVLGDYAGRGLEYNRSKNFTFENAETGFWVTLVCIVPESGYCQAIDRSVTQRTPFDFYQPDFDALGYEATAKDMVVGAVDWSSPSSAVGSLFSSFGFVPTYSSMKVANNVLNGDFSLRGTRDSYLPFTLDKIISVGERAVYHDTALDTGDSNGYRCYHLLRPSDLPTASPIWRYVGRYPWLGLYNRIFNQVGTQLESDPRYYWFDNSGYSKYIYLYNDYDNFLCHNIFNVQQWAPMLPIEKSFETYEEGEEAPNSSMGKA